MKKLLVHPRRRWPPPSTQLLIIIFQNRCETRLRMLAKEGRRRSMAISRRSMALNSFFGDGRRRSNIFNPFFLEIWDPFDRSPFRSLTGNRPNFSSFPAETSSFARANIDWRETPNAHVFKADLPGLKKEEVKVEVDDGRVLQISGEKSRETEDKGDTWHRVERSSGRFSRRFVLPENAKIEQVKASMEDGVLTVTVPKQEEEKKANVRTIEISG